MSIMFFLLKKHVYYGLETIQKYNMREGKKKKNTIVSFKIVKKVYKPPNKKKNTIMKICI